MFIKQSIASGLLGSAEASTFSRDGWYVSETFAETEHVEQSMPQFAFRRHFVSPVTLSS